MTASKTEPTSLNIHQRKREVMRKVGEIHHDKTHPHHGYTYNSIDNVSNALRELFIEHGIDYCPSLTTDGTMVVELVNVDDPSDKIVSSWPLVEDDKGFAYSTKFPLVRMFLIADSAADDPNQSGEADESKMAANSGRAVTPGRPTAPARAQGRPTAQASNLCPDCAALGWKSKNGYPPKFWPNDRGGPDQCDGISEVDGKRIYHRKEVQPRLTGVGAAVEALFADGTPVPEGPDS